MDKRKTHRSIRERWVVEGTLLLETPAHFGNGDADALTDMPLLFDEASNVPLLPGTSIAGALRNYLREFELNYSVDFPDMSNQDKVERERGLLATRLCGAFRDDDKGDQSPLIVYDALGKFPTGNASTIELRDSVKIDLETRTAEDQKKFDIQLLAAGTTFDLRFDLLISEADKETDKLKSALATALMGLTNRQITLGARKRRGFGQCRVIDEWKVQVYNLKNPAGLKAWLASETIWADKFPLPDQSKIDLAALIDAKDNRQTAYLTAEFNIEGTLLIRAGFGESDKKISPETVHLHSQRPGIDKHMPIIPGTSWSGVLRHRALKIARTVSNDLKAVDKEGKPLHKITKDKEKIQLLKAEVFIDNLFGPSEIKKGNKDTKASRIAIKESVIEYPAESLIVTRVKIDRFTGGAYEGALFSEQPVIGKPETCIKLDLSLRNPTHAELGLLLLLLKDLWTGDLPIGGESSIGRERLKGLNATLTTRGSTWKFTADGEKVNVEPNPDDLETWVTTFNKEVLKAQVNHE